jgi:hypothetical protein
MQDTMDILHIERKGPLMNTLERFHIYSLSKENLQMHDTYTDMHNPIFNLIKEHYAIKNLILHPQPTNPIATPTPSPPLLPTTFINNRAYNKVLSCPLHYTICTLMILSKPQV